MSVSLQNSRRTGGCAPVVGFRAGPGCFLLAVATVLLAGGAAFAQNNVDRDALVDFYNATDGPGWRTNDGWLTSAPLEEWYGVGMDLNGRVVSLSLGGNALIGSIPSSLGSLTNLQFLNLQNNGLSGSIPSSLGSLRDLQHLYLNDNRLSGSVPSSLGSLNTLFWFYLSNNRLTDPLPQSLVRLPYLERFFFEDNDGLCAPANAEFQAWLAELYYVDGPNCLEAPDAPAAPVLPGAPAAPVLTGGAGTLEVAWSAPADGGSAVVGYNVRYRSSGSSDWMDHPHASAETTATITGLTNGQSYEVQVQALSEGGAGPWSVSATATPLAPKPDAPATPVPVLPPAGVVLLMALLFGAAGRLTRGRRS